MEILLSTIVGSIVSIVVSIIGLLAHKTFKRKVSVTIDNQNIDIDLKNIEKTMASLEKAIAITRENPKVFLSYSSKDKDLATKLNDDLIKAGIKTWFDESDIRFGDSISKKIDEGINESQWYLQLITPESSESGWMHKELSKIIDMEYKRNRKLLIPVVSTNLELPEEIRDRKYVNIGEDYQKSITALIDTIKYKNTK